MHPILYGCTVILLYLQSLLRHWSFAGKERRLKKYSRLTLYALTVVGGAVKLGSCGGSLGGVCRSVPALRGRRVAATARLRGAGTLPRLAHQICQVMDSTGVAVQASGCDDWRFARWSRSRLSSRHCALISDFHTTFPRIATFMQDAAFQFDYEVPRRLVAQEPLRHRADARLMVVDRANRTIEHHHVRDLPHLLKVGDRLVLNDTKVIRAQLAGTRVATNGRWQGLYIESTPDGNWKILCKTRGRLAPGEAIMLRDREGRPGVKLWLIERLTEGQWLAHAESEEPTETLLERLGRVPLPPYIRGGNMVDDDVVNYQTVYAQRPGAIAAPTAGLHFTRELLKALEARGVAFSRITLHVGLGTFRPIETESLEEHRMHSEWGEITATTAAELNQTRAGGGRVIAVGTTVVRTLETVAKNKLVTDEPDRSSRELSAWQGTTDLFIRPPFTFRAVDALLTNFHFPRTTLLVLVQTFGGAELIAEAYRQAIREEYRFFSYGDAMLIV